MQTSAATQVFGLAAKVALSQAPVPKRQDFQAQAFPAQASQTQTSQSQANQFQAPSQSVGVEGPSSSANAAASNVASVSSASSVPNGGAAPSSLSDRAQANTLTNDRLSLSEGSKQRAQARGVEPVANISIAAAPGSKTSSAADADTSSDAQISSEQVVPTELDRSSERRPAGSAPQGDQEGGQGGADKSSGDGDGRTNAGGQSPASGNQNDLTEAQLRQVRELSARDAEVKAHEQAHKAVGGQYTGAISYSYQQGPDGKRYAVGGEVPIDVSEVSGDPQATIEKMRVVKAAALAPAEPSSQDQRVAALASQSIASAQVELATLNREQQLQQREDAKAERADGAGESTVQSQQGNSALAGRGIANYQSVSAIDPSRGDEGFSIINAIA